MNAEIAIALNENGHLALQVQGPLAGNRIIILGMLEQAKELILHPPKEASPIALAREIPGLRNGK